MSSEVRVGTSGWQYKDWNGRFYPEDVKGKTQLEYYSKHFDTVEINTTFYHMPRLSSVESWEKSVPDNFCFVVKLNRYLTHTKRLKNDEQFNERLRAFLNLLKPMRSKLAIVLAQLPPNLQASSERLEGLARHFKSIPLAVEFRHASWFNDEIYSLMRKYNLANVVNSSPGRWPASKEITADFAYLRFHGSKRLYRSSYSSKELENWAGFIKKEAIGCKRVFCFFNNDYNAVAIRNAKSLKRII